MPTHPERLVFGSFGPLIATAAYLISQPRPWDVIIVALAFGIVFIISAWDDGSA